MPIGQRRAKRRSYPPIRSAGSRAIPSIIPSHRVTNEIAAASTAYEEGLGNGRLSNGLCPFGRQPDNRLAQGVELHQGFVNRSVFDPEARQVFETLQVRERAWPADLNSLDERATELALQLDALANCVRLIGSEAAKARPIFLPQDMIRRAASAMRESRSSDLFFLATRAWRPAFAMSTTSPSLSPISTNRRVARRARRLTACMTSDLDLRAGRGEVQLLRRD